MKKGFFAYPSEPNDIGACIEAAVKKFNAISSDEIIGTWRALDIPGHFISGEVLSGISESDFFVADITNLNFNVTYEIGYAIGLGKRVLLLRNKSLNRYGVSIDEVGIFDTLGYNEYQNSDELQSFLRSANKNEPIQIDKTLNPKAPVYLMETEFKTDWMTRLVSRVKKAGFKFRNFDPNESPRLSAYEAIDHVSSSYGVVVPFLASKYKNRDIHNIRAAFIAGLSEGMGKVTLTLQETYDPIPIDYRDSTRVANIDKINELIAEFASQVTIAFQEYSNLPIKKEKQFLKELKFGATSAENEMQDLSNYYLETDQFLKALRGEVEIVVGRKGAGKSAIFLQIRDKERDQNRAKNIVVDLKPDGYKLIKFKEDVLNFLSDGTLLHTITAFWEFVLFIEIAYKILEKDKQRHLNDHKLYEPYRTLQELYLDNGYGAEGDFSERMSSLISQIRDHFDSCYPSQNEIKLNSAQITQLVQTRSISEIKQQVIKYLENKESLWLLFDNIDNGWPTDGLMRDDLLMIRGLIDASRKISRILDKTKIRFNSIVFLRNDVYELLVQETADKGKDKLVLLDWFDEDLLRELVRLRIISNPIVSEDICAKYDYIDFKLAWSLVFVPHYKGEETSKLLIDMSLMRPRFLLNLINHCRGFAVNLNHEKILEEDIEKGIALYSDDLLKDISYELRDVAPELDDILYQFLGTSNILDISSIKQLISSYVEMPFDKILNLLLWYGFLGVEVNNEIKYIYDFRYNLKIMKTVVDKLGNNAMFTINNGFRKSLMID